MCYCAEERLDRVPFESLIPTRPEAHEAKKALITGFNTDVEHDGVTYHVQTEDKGLETPLILSLVYTGGEILASKRVRYDDLVASGFDERVLADRLQRQHKLICAAIRAGRLEELKKMSERESASRSAARKEAAPSPALPVEPVEPLEPLPVEPLPSEPELLPVEVSAPAYPDEPHPIELMPSQPLELPSLPTDLPPPAPAVSIPALLKKSSSRRPSAGRNSKRLTPPPAQPAQSAPPTAPTPRRPSPKPVPEFAYGEAPTSEALRLSLIDEKNYRGGDHLILRAHVAHGTEGRDPLSGAEVIVKILGSTFRPLILQTQTGADGIATFSIQLPHFRSGRAAILIRATSGGYEAELRRIIQQG
jgi:hypothetical protein